MYLILINHFNKIFNKSFNINVKLKDGDKVLLLLLCFLYHWIIIFIILLYKKYII